MTACATGIEVVLYVYDGAITASFVAVLERAMSQIAVFIAFITYGCTIPAMIWIRRCIYFFSIAVLDWVFNTLAGATDESTFTGAVTLAAIVLIIVYVYPFAITNGISTLAFPAIPR